MLTIDKEELLKLQDDVYQHPQKYDTMLTEYEAHDYGQVRHYWNRDRNPTIESGRLQDYQYWHSMLNDGTESIENWPYYREYMAYKHWFDQVEDKALDTLKLAIS